MILIIKRIMVKLLTFLILISLIIVSFQCYAEYGVSPLPVSIQSASMGSPTSSDHLFSHIPLVEGCTLAIVRDTTDGSTLMMKTRDIFGGGGSAKSIIEHKSVTGGYNYTGVFDGSVGSQVWMGANEAGLCIENSYACNLNAGSGGVDNGEVNRILLENCGSVDDVDAMLRDPGSAVGPYKRASNANIGTIDRFGNAAFFEVDCTDHIKCPVTGRFDVRANWALNHPNRTNAKLGEPRYYRAKSMLENETNIDYRWMCQNLSKDLGPRPYPIVIDANDKISQYCTVSCTVFIGGRQNYTGKTTCIWTSLGEPSLGLYTPIFPYAGTTPSVLDNFYNEIHKKKLYCYDSYTDNTMNIVPLLTIQNYSLQIESVEFNHFDSLMTDVLKKSPMSDLLLKKGLQGYVENDTYNATYYYKMEMLWPSFIREYNRYAYMVFLPVAVLIFLAIWLRKD